MRAGRVLGFVVIIVGFLAAIASLAQVLPQVGSVSFQGAVILGVVADVLRAACLVSLGIVGMRLLSYIGIMSAAAQGKSDAVLCAETYAQKDVRAVAQGDLVCGIGMLVFAFLDNGWLVFNPLNADNSIVRFSAFIGTVYVLRIIVPLLFCAIAIVFYVRNRGDSLQEGGRFSLLSRTAAVFLLLYIVVVLLQYGLPALMGGFADGAGLVGVDGLAASAVGGRLFDATWITALSVVRHFIFFCYLFFRGFYWVIMATEKKRYSK